MRGSSSAGVYFLPIDLSPGGRPRKRPGEIWEKYGKYLGGFGLIPDFQGDYRPTGGHVERGRVKGWRAEENGGIVGETVALQREAVDE